MQSFLTFSFSKRHSPNKLLVLFLIVKLGEPFFVLFKAKYIKEVTPTNGYQRGRLSYLTKKGGCLNHWENC